MFVVFAAAVTHMTRDLHEVLLSEWARQTPPGMLKYSQVTAADGWR